VVEDPARLEVAQARVVIEAPASGYVTRADALEIGLAAVAMGAGRSRADQAVDHQVGILVHAKPGTRVERGEPLATLLVRSESDAQSIQGRVTSAFSVGAAAPEPQVRVLGRIPSSVS
jgi:thymidine phosphorylase